MRPRAGPILRKARRDAGLTQAALERMTGIPRSAISMYETGGREPGADAFLGLLAAAGSDLRVDRFSDEQLRRGRALADLLRFASELPHRWPGDVIGFPAEVWRR